jgi:hypothetical protein
MNLFHKSARPKTTNVQGISSGAQRSISPLEKLVTNDPTMLAALQNFLITDPRRQLRSLDNVNVLLAKGNEAKAKGNNQSARVNYEVAARIEIYNQNVESARNFLVLAEQVSDPAGEHYAFQKTMLADMDKVLGISKAYHAPLETP